MPIEVIFRGPTLYLNRGAVAECALVPDGERTLYDDRGRPGRHPDGSIATPHYAGLLIVEGAVGAEVETFRADLRGKVLTLASEGGTTCGLSADYGELIAIDDLANHGMAVPMKLISPNANDYWTRVATRVMFRGGTLRADIRSTASFRIASSVPSLQASRSIPLSAVWAAGTPAARLVMSDSDGTDCVCIQLKEGQRVVIYNWDEKTPAFQDLIHPGHPCVAQPDEQEDVDFKWMYELFNPPAVTYSAWLGDKEGTLRVPTTNCKLARVGAPMPPDPGSSGCASARATIL